MVRQMFPHASLHPRDLAKKSAQIASHALVPPPPKGEANHEESDIPLSVAASSIERDEHKARADHITAQSKLLSNSLQMANRAVPLVCGISDGSIKLRSPVLNLGHLSDTNGSVSRQNF